MVMTILIIIKNNKNNKAQLHLGVTPFTNPLQTPPVYLGYLHYLNNMHKYLVVILNKIYKEENTGY